MDRLSGILRGQGSLIKQQENASAGALERARAFDHHEPQRVRLDQVMAELERAPVTTRGDDKYWEALAIKPKCTLGCGQENCELVDNGHGEMAGSLCSIVHHSFANDGPNTRTFKDQNQQEKDAKLQNSEDTKKVAKDLSTITKFDIDNDDPEILRKASNRLNQCHYWMRFVNDPKPGGFRLSDDDIQSCKVSFHAASVQWAVDGCDSTNMASPVFWVIAAVQNAVAMGPDGYKLPTEELRLRLTLKGMHDYLSQFQGEEGTTDESELNATKVHGKKGVSKEQRALEKIKRRKARFDALGDTDHKRYEKLLVFHKLLVKSKAWPSPKGYRGLCAPVLKLHAPGLLVTKQQRCSTDDFVAPKRARMGLNEHTNSDDFDLEAMDEKANAAAAKAVTEAERASGEKTKKKKEEEEDVVMFDEEELKEAEEARKKKLEATAAAAAAPSQQLSAAEAEAAAATAAAVAAAAAAAAAQAAADAAAAVAAAAKVKAEEALAPLAPVGGEEAAGAEEEEEGDEEVPEDFGLTGEERDALFDEEEAAMDAEAAWAAAMATAEEVAVVPPVGGPTAIEAPKSLKVKNKGPRETDAQLARLSPYMFLRSNAYNNCKTAADQKALKELIAPKREAYLLRIKAQKERAGALEAAKAAAKKKRVDARAARLAKEEERHQSSLENRGFNQIMSQGAKKEKAEARLQRGKAATYIEPTDEATDRKGKTLAPMVIKHVEPAAPPIRISRAQWEAFNEVKVEEPKDTVRVKMTGAKRELERTTEPNPNEGEFKCNGGDISRADLFPKGKRSRRG